MGTREEIKKFISLYLRQQFTTDEMPENECDSEAEFIIRYLHENDVVIKVDRELPLMVTDYGITRHADAIFIDAKALKEQGYVATIPLIKK